MALVVAFVPACPGNPEATGRRELSAFGKPQVWLTMVAGAVGFGGMFALFSYIAPTVTEVSGLPASAVPVFLLTLGVGMVVGNWAAGVLVDRSVLRVPARLVDRPRRRAARVLGGWRPTAGRRCRPRSRSPSSARCSRCR